MDDAAGRLRCPYCRAYAVERMYLGTAKLDSCECRSCNARWDEEPLSGAFRGRSSHHLATGLHRRS